MSIVYFTDRDLGIAFPRFSDRNGLMIERHADHFALDTRDEVWLATIGKHGWIALTHDRRIRYKPNERDAVMRHNVGLLVIVGTAPFPELARSFVCQTSSTSFADTSRHSSLRFIGRRPPDPRAEASHQDVSNYGIRRAPYLDDHSYL